MMRGLEVGLAALAAAGVAGCCAYRGISQTSAVHVRSLSVDGSGGAGANSVAEVGANSVRVLTGPVVAVAENLYVSLGGGRASSNMFVGELSYRWPSGMFTLRPPGEGSVRAGKAVSPGFPVPNSDRVSGSISGLKSGPFA